MNYPLSAFLCLCWFHATCLLFAAAVESPVLNALAASGTGVGMAEDCIFLFLFFKVELRGETTCVLQKGVLRWLVREGDPLLAPHGHGFQVQI